MFEPLRTLPPRSRLGRVVPVLIVLTLGGLAVGATVVVRSLHPPLASPTRSLRGAELDSARTGAATCTDPAAGQQWRVSWRATSGDAQADPELTPTGFAVRSLAPPAVAATASATAGSTADVTADATASSTGGPNSTADWRTADDARWALQWNPTRAEMLTGTQDEAHELVGSLSVLASAKLDAGDSPRYVTPDGACTVFLSPFAPQPPADAAMVAGPVAVIGDSLLAQLYPPDDGTSVAGALSRRLNAFGHRAEIVGQNAQLWTGPPGVGPGLARANLTMLDEMRGLRDASAMVIALGQNDAGWVALASDPAQFERRIGWVTRHLAPVLEELREGGRCTVLITIATLDKRYSGASAARVQLAARRINGYLRAQADASPDDQLKLSDWAALADQHTGVDPVPWFGASTVHLNEAGIAGYADELVRATALC